MSRLELAPILLVFQALGPTGPDADTPCAVAARQARDDDGATSDELSSVMSICFSTADGAGSPGTAAGALADAIKLTRFADLTHAQPFQDQIVDHFLRLARGAGAVSPETYAGFARFLLECSGRAPGAHDYWRGPEQQRLYTLLERIEAQLAEPILRFATLRARAENRLIMDRIFGGIPYQERQSLLCDLRAAQAACADLRIGDDPVMDDGWHRMLAELSELHVGAQAPEIVGVDLDERPIRLSDFHGRVIALMCWASWCPTCLTQVPRERALAKRFEGRPFVFLGLNGDPDLSSAQRAAKRHQLTWRSFWGHWNGPFGEETPLQERWNVTMWPTVYVIDAAAYIRYKYCWDTKFDELEREIETALAGAGD